MDRKSEQPRPLPVRLVASRRQWAPYWALALLVTALFSLHRTIYAPAALPASVAADPFSWDRIAPSESLQYHDCGGGFQCARLEVPMDYNRTDNSGRKFALAIVRLPAKVPVGDPRYGGPVLINPGGPGGPGTLSAFLSGRNLQTIVDAESDPDHRGDATDKYFDIVGFDPRGVGSTTPAVTCFPDPTSQRNWELQVEAEGMLGSCPDALRRNWQRNEALNLGCSVYDMTASQDEEPFMPYVGTPLVAQDMVTIIERHGEWRAKEGLAAQSAHNKQHGEDSSRAIVKRTKWRRGEEPLLYWGRSYGTVLGTTFAALFPDRVSRAVLDGVVNMDTYYRAKGPNVIVDADAIFDRFGHYCDAVGPEGCPFYTDGGPEAIQNAYWALEDKLLNRSIPVIASASRGPEVVTWTDIKAILRLAVYQPLLVFPILAERMAQLASGDAARLADFKHRRHFGVCPSSECSIAGPWSPACTRGQENSLYASTAVLCTDAEFLTRSDVDAFTTSWDSLKADSATLGDYWAQLQLSCVGWKTQSKYKFSGPWGGATSHPMLFVANTLDPVTPLRSAIHMSQQFPGSAVLQQDSEGHTTIAAPSICIAKAIRGYFQTGVLPKNGTLCAADLKPMLGRVEHAAALAQDMSPGDRVLFDALMAEVKERRWSHGPL